jgi:hypothetical protein
MSALERYLQAAKDAGVPPEGVRILLSAGFVLQPRQLEATAAAYECDKPCEHDADTPCGPGCGPTEVGFGGSRDGGKSHWSMAKLLLDCLRFPGLKCLVLRKIGKA